MAELHRMYEYEAMYSPHVVQKRKVWHDGVLKYYTRNKRLVLDDEEGRFVADCWLEGSIGRGEELRFDRHIVEVGEVKKVVEKTVEATHEHRSRRPVAMEDPKYHRNLKDVPLKELICQVQEKAAPNAKSPTTPGAREATGEKAMKAKGCDTLLKETVAVGTVPQETSFEQVSTLQQTPGAPRTPTSSTSNIQSTAPSSHTSHTSPLFLAGVETKGEPDTLEWELADLERPDPDALSDESDVEILNVRRVTPSQSNVSTPLRCPSKGPWTEEAYILFTWRPPAVKEEPG